MKKKNFKNIKLNSAFTILELLITMVLVSALTAPILNTFQVSERLGERSKRSFIAQNLAREMMAEISAKSFNDPDEPDTVNVNLKPGPYHEEYNALAPKIQNGTGENEAPRFFNETLLNRNKYFDDIDDYADYNTDEALLPTLSSGKEYLVNGQNLYENYRVKVSVTTDTSKTMESKSVLDNGIIPGTLLTGIAATTDSRYILSLNGDEKTVSVINTRTNKEIDTDPSTAASERIKLDNSTIPSKILLGASQDRFFVLNKAVNDKIESTSSISVIDMNPFNAPEYSFHKVHDITSNGLKSNSFTAIAADKKSRIFAGTVNGGLVRSLDNGVSWQLMNIKTDSGDIENTITCLATVNYGYGAGSDITYAGSAGGLWYTENGGESWKKIPDIKNVTAVAAMPNGYMAAGLSGGKLYGFKKFAVNDEYPFRSAVSGPVPNAVDSIVIDKNYNLIIASNGKTYYSANFFDSDISAGSMPAPVFSQYSQIPDNHNVSSLYIDRSATCPANFKKITGLTPGSATAKEFAPAVYANEAGIHLFYLSGEASGTGGTVGTPHLYYVSSSNCGQSWSTPKKISYLNKSLEPAWAHSEAIDKYGTMHVSWFSKINGCWKLCYQRGDHYGLSWLTSEVILAGDTVDICINDLKFSETSDPKRATNGAGKHQNICVSPLNRVYIAFSGNSNSKFHYLIWSYDGGTGWAAKDMIKIPKPADRSDEIVESINYISPDNRILWIFKSSEKRRMMMTDSDGNVLSGQNGCFDINQISESAPLLMDKNLIYRYFYVQNNRLCQHAGNFPYAECRSAGYSFQPYADDIFQSASKKNNIYTFYKSQNKIFAIKSSNNGIAAQVPIFIRDCGAGGSAASAAYRNDVYFVTCPEDSSSNSSLQLCLFSDETLFGGGHNFCFTEDLKNFPAILSGNTYQDCGFTVNCFQGDANGNILCGTSDGLLVLNSRTANTVEKAAGDIYSTYNSRFRSITAGGQAKTWSSYFKGVKITAVYLEPGGSFWAATADRGIFHSSDYGESWENITATIADIVDISVPGTGQAADINKINIFSRRHNLKIAPDGSGTQIVQHLASVFNLSNNKIESVTVISDNYGGEKAAAASYDNSKIYIFEKNEKNIYSKKHNRISKNIVQAAQSGYLLTGLIANANDTLEISAGGKFWLDKENTYFCSTAAGMNCDFRQDAAGKNYIGSLILKTGGGYASVNQYYNGPAIGSGELAYQISADSYSKTNGFLTVTTGINSAREVISLQNKINSAANLIAAPDNQTLYAIDAGAQKVYAVTNINNPAQVVVKEYSKNINIPLDVIFSPKNSDGQFKTYIVCQSNIIDLEGNKILNEAGAFNIQAAIANDGGDLFFIDKLTKKIFKCSKVNEKTVYVTVSDTDVRAAGSMPPVTIAKKFYQWRSGDFKSYHLVGGQKPNRDYFKYNFIYTSKEYPSGITAGQKVRWQLKKNGTNDILNVYVVDSVLEINGELEIQPAALVKFAAADKNINPDNFSGKASSCLKTNAGGKLTIAGKVNDNEKVIFTSIDDNKLAPSVYNAPDGVFSTADGYPNTQIAKGPMPGDWGYSDGESKQYGGIQLQPGDDITGLETYYGLFYTASLYPETIKKKNYDNCQGEGGLLNEWSPTNVFVVNNQIEVQSGSSITAAQGTIIKFDGAGKIKINRSAQQLPGPSIIFNGSFAKNIIMDSITSENISGEFKTPSKSTGGYWTFIDSLNTCETGIFKNITAANVNALSLNGSSLIFINCNFKLSNPAVFKAEIRQKDFSSFINCEFNIARGGILSTLGSSNEFMNCTFGNKPYQTGSDEDYGIKSSEGASVYLKNNKFEYLQAGSSSSDSAVSGSRIYSDSIISAENNFFIIHRPTRQLRAK
ncbi:MAG: hypothetical protein QMC67_07300 [Candidatus Wallbacteria bacterium]